MNEHCLQMFEGYYCTLRPGHKGQHQANGTGPKPYRVWGEPSIPERIEVIVHLNGSGHVLALAGVLPERADCRFVERIDGGGSRYTYDDYDLTVYP